MNKTKKQKAFNISIAFGVLALLFACIFASFFVNTPNVLAYIDNSVSSTLISSNKKYKGNGLYDSSLQYGVRYPAGTNVAWVTYCLNYTFTQSVEFDSFLISFSNYEGVFDRPLYYQQLSGFSFLVAISSVVDSTSWYEYNFGDMIALDRPDNEFTSYLSEWGQDDNNPYGLGTYLIHFDSTQEISNSGMLTVYVNMTFNMSSTEWTSFVGWNTYDRYKNCFDIQVLELGSVETDGSYNNGYLVGYNQGKSLSNQTSYDNGYTAGLEAGGNIGSWLAGVGEAPLTLIKSLFNIEIFGINLNTILFSLLGALVVIKLIRLFI